MYLASDYISTVPDDPLNASELAGILGEGLLPACRAGLYISLRVLQQVGI